MYICIYIFIGVAVEGSHSIVHDSHHIVQYHIVDGLVLFALV